MRAAGLGVLALLLVVSQTLAQEAPPLKGVALVIGNSAYEHLSALPNPANDARAVESLLNDLGFRTQLSSDHDGRRLARDLRDFIEDARGADVAVVYYAGHGIEAGGENFLVPVDADLSALDVAGEKLVPISSFVMRLQATVPVAIVMLDACRDNPFPAGSMVRLDASADPLPMGAGGLGEARGATRLAPVASQNESYGTVIAFAAEPGHVALDGEPDGNSPYTQAVLRHFDAMAGEEFGIVMRMVAEEVYLKTSGRQHPWVNENLRRLLYFGNAPAPLAGEEGELLAERRQLLLTIASLPDANLRRGQVERVAAAEGVPLDAVYGMLRALGADAPQDPAELEKALRAEAERFANVLAEREIINSPDSEIVRLTSLADRAERKGLLSAADTFRERAKARYLETEPTLEEQEEALRRRFVEGAAVFARSAGTKALAFDHLAAAQDYAEAFRRVDDRDAQLAFRYKQAETLALTDHGDYKGDNAVLERAIVAGRQALRMAEDLGDRENWAATQIDLGNALWTLGERESGTARLEEAVAAFRAALEEYTHERVPLGWAGTQNNLGNVLQTLGSRESGTARLEEAVAAYRATLEEFTRERVPLDWAGTQNNLGNALWTLGKRESGTARLEEAVAAFRAALEEYTRERVPLDWAMTQNNLGNALQEFNKHEGGVARLEEAVVAYRAALEERTRERVPLDWATTQSNLGTALQALGELEGSVARLEEAVAAFRAALEERTRTRVPLQWAMTQNNLGVALRALGERENGTARLEEAVVAYRAALEERTRTRVPFDWATTQGNLGSALRVLGERENDTARLEEAATAHRAALEEYTRERVPLGWATIQYNLGNTLATLGEREEDIARLEEAVVAYRAALEERTRTRVPLVWARTQNNLGIALQALGERENGMARLEEAVAAYRAALEERTRTRVPLDWAMTQYNLGGALVEMGRRSANKAEIEEGRTAIMAAWQVCREEGQTQYDSYFQQRIAEAEAALAALE